MFKRPTEELKADLLLTKLFVMAQSREYRTPEAFLHAAQEQLPDVSRQRIIAAATYLSELLTQGLAPSRSVETPDFLEKFADSPMPKYDGAEPSEFEVRRIKKFMEEGRFGELSEAHQKWVCCRLMPSLTRYGVYPPPHEAVGPANNQPSQES